MPRNGLDRFSGKLAIKSKFSSWYFRRWKNEIIKACQRYLREEPNQEGFLNSSGGLKLLRRAQRDFVFAPADKAQNNIVCICKRYY